MLLELDSVEFGWKESNKIINVNTFSMDHGQHTFIMGPSGSGKSTLLNLIGGILKPQRGHIILNEHPITTLSARKRDQLRADHIGFIFQQFNLIPYLSAVENVRLACQFSNQRARNAKSRKGGEQQAALTLLDGFFIQNKPDFNRPVVQLSVGQQQRVAAARALVGDPAIIIADEPTSALDHDSRQQFMSLLLGEADRQGSTVLFVSHDPTLADRFDTVCHLSDFNHC